MASLSLRNVTKKYPNGFVAVKDFNLEIEDKEFIIFVGPSGCGKSTTLRQADERCGAQGQGYRHGIPELRSVSSYVRI